MRQVKDIVALLKKLHYFDKKFKLFINQNNNHLIVEYPELCGIIDEYSSFIINHDNETKWGNLEQSIEILPLVENLRSNSSVCVQIMEKYRALVLSHENEEITDYFRNIEDCIEKEFGGFQITSQSKVLLVGSGSFPITLLMIAERTGAEVFGIDIDNEAVQLGKHVVNKLGSQLSIQIDNKTVRELPVIKRITHIIFSSTVNCKYDILDQLYDLTNKDVLIAMRYGNGLKSLFNYPMKEVDENKWYIKEKTVHPQSVFDVILYQKVQ
ncbi:SAM-dependent methyltransferase [Lysinibacillus xylanilyticus]|uniref:SAM-dependent methyltransferase n=1 Tax=Lysinibacillus xylanilyticus TaxID=582475 RepID=A0A2M9Q4X1_9BACI|nr:SAM-dependent methyltransferase [Lysinibacillus xylanilyticus]